MGDSELAPKIVDSDSNKLRVGGTIRDVVRFGQFFAFEFFFRRFWRDNVVSELRDVFAQRCPDHRIAADVAAAASAAPEPVTPRCNEDTASVDEANHGRVSSGNSSGFEA